MDNSQTNRNIINVSTPQGQGHLTISTPSNIRQTMDVTNNRAQYYADLAKKYKDEAKEFRDNARYYSEQNADVTMEYVNELETRLQRDISAKQNSGDYALRSEIPTNVSTLTNDSNYVNSTQLSSAVDSVRLPSQTGKEGTFLYTDGETASWKKMNSHNLFDLVTKDHILTYEETQGFAQLGTFVYKEAVTGSRYGYADFYEKCLDEFQNENNSIQIINNNYTVVGSPAISTDGTVTFSNGGNRIVLDAAIDYTAPFKIKTRFKITGIGKGDNQCLFAFFGYDDRWNNLRIIPNNSNKFGFSFLKNSVKTERSVAGTSANYDFNTFYDIIFGWNGSKYTLDIKKSTEKSYTNAFNYTDSTSLSTAVASPTNIVLGNRYSTWYLDGVIDLKYVSIGNGSSAQFNAVDYVAANSNGHKFYNITNKSYIDDIYDLNGAAWYYGVDVINERIFLPRNDWFFQSGDNQNVGEYNEAGLPNIEGSVPAFTCGGPTSADGAFDLYGTGSAYGGGSSSGQGFDFDASRSNSIYGNSTTVQPSSVNAIVYMVVGNTATDSSGINNVQILAENDTFPMFAGMYLDYEPNNVSWIKAGVQVNSGAIYQTAYNALVNELTTPVYGLKVIETSQMISGTDYSEFWKINQNSMTFVCPSSISYSTNPSSAQLYFKVANAVENASVVNAGNILSSLVEKIGKSECPAYVVETYNNGASWYRIYSDGWCEQGSLAQANSTSSAQVIGLLKNYKDTDYSIQITRAANADNYMQITVTNKTVSSFTVGYSCNKYWRTCGYIN